MKRFFSRFSVAGPTSPTQPGSETAFNRSEKQDLSLAGAPKPVPAVAVQDSSIGRTKALVAKFEGDAPSQPISSHLSTSFSTNLQPSIPIPSAQSLNFDQHRDHSDHVIASPVAGSVPSGIPGSSLPADTSKHPRAADVGFSNQKPTRDASTDRDQRQASSGSQSASSTTHASKTVAFAPSPQKQRSTSPSHHGPAQRAPQPLSRTNSSDTNPVASGSSFAKPTAASQARARTWTRSASSDASQSVAASTASSVRDKGVSSFMRPLRSSQASSAHTAARRSYSHSSGPHGREIENLAAPSASSIVGTRTSDAPLSLSRRTSIDAAQIGRISPTKSSDRAQSHPGHLQFPSRTSLPMRMSLSGSSSSRPASRRNSADPTSPTDSNDPVMFPPSGASGPQSFGFPTWSEMTNQDLVRNLGPRERTRQEVLWEIVASEERYVMELEKAKEMYIDALIHPDAFKPERVLPPIYQPNAISSSDGIASPTSALPTGSAIAESSSQRASAADLPIAARFMSNGSSGRHSSALPVATQRDAQTQWDKQQAAGGRSPYSVGLGASSASDNPVARPGPHHRMNTSFGLGLGLGTTATRDRSTAAYMNVPIDSKATGKVSKAHKLRGRLGKAGDADPLHLSVPLPSSLREVLVAISDGLVEAHGMLSDALKGRYEEQWPLVRSLADVFMKYSHILEHYANYVCHLQRAMEELEEAALMERAFRGKRLKKELLSNTVGLGRTVAALEACAAEQGYAGLSIFASMPFQRLLKYPLLFQNLLFHTDPSTHEFESTVAMVVEVERLVRSIEDEKVNAEERDKTRDVFARIDGITDRQVLVPRPDRILVEEKALYDEHARRTLSESAPKDGRSDTYASDSEGVESGNESSGPAGSRTSGGRWSGSNQSALRAALRNKRSYRRLSDFLSSDASGGTSSKAPSMGSKKDLWLIRFSDVEIKCQRIGVTALPMVSTAALRTLDAPERDGADDFAARSKDSRERLKALRNTTLRAKTRNLYKFISVVAWRNAASRQIDGAKQGFAEGLPTSHEVDEEDEGDDDDDDDGVSVSSDGGSATSSSSSGSSDGVGGQAGSEKYIRSTKLSFTYWGDRIEPGRAIGGAATSGVPARSQTKDRSSRRSEAHVQRRGQRSSESGSARHPRYSTPTSRGPALSRSVGKSGMSGRLSEPLSATSMSTAPEPMQTAVAQMHARLRNEKFGGRLRNSVASGSSGGTTGKEGELNGSHLSVNTADRRASVSGPS